MKSGAHPSKIKVVMKEFKEGKLKSGASDKKVTNPKQAMAIALSEAGMSKSKKSWGGYMEKEKKRGGGAIMKEKKSTMGEALSKGGMGHYDDGGESDVKQDKALIKKAFKMHDMQEHKGEHTNLDKLKKGGKEESKAHEKKESKKEEMMEDEAEGMATGNFAMVKPVSGNVESPKASMLLSHSMRRIRGGGAIMSSKKSTMGEALSEGGEVKGTGAAIKGFRPAKMC
jgi:Family of unknown function (DUF6496)